MLTKRLYPYLACLFLILYIGCSVRATVTPRSELIATSKNQGLDVLTIEEEVARFKSHESNQRSRLEHLIEERLTNAESRDPSYRLGVGDEIEINVFDVEELNTTVRVRPSGFISLPLLGAVKARGKTESELVAELRKRLRDYVREPEISLFISHYASQKVSVMGAVAKPGTYSLKKGENTIHELIGRAGGADYKAGGYINLIPAQVAVEVDADEDKEGSGQIVRTARKEAAIEVPLDEILGTSGGIPIEIPVVGGDVIVIPEAGSVAVEGEVQKPGTYELKNRSTLLGGLAAAGGIGYGALFEEVELIRRLDHGEPLRYVVNLEDIASGKEQDVRLRNGDIIRVPSHDGRRLGQDTFESISRLINFGVGGSYRF